MSSTKAGLSFLVSLSIAAAANAQWLDYPMELFKKRSAELGLNDPVAACLPSGGPLRLLTFPPPRKIIQLPGLVVMLSERDVTVDDPKAYTRLWTVTLTQLLMPDTELLNYHCMDYPAEPGERSPATGVRV
jgi:hypothetical protein